jgi:hypothetical protein
VPVTDVPEVPLEGIDQALGEHRPPVLPPLPVAHDDLPPVEVDLVHSEARALEEAQSPTVEQPPHQPWRAGESREEPRDLLAGEHGRESCRPASTDDLVQPRELHSVHIAVEEQKRAQRLVLGRRADGAIDGEVSEEALDLRLA